MGLENPIEEMQEDQRRQVAYHEAGHAIIQYYLRPDERIVRVSIVRRSEAMGYVLHVPNYDVHGYPLRKIVSHILVAMAGHVATKIFLGEYWTGAGSDFQQVRNNLAELAHYGYFGPPLVMDQTAGYGSRDKADIIDKFWRKLEDKTSQILLEHSAEVHAVAQALLERSDLTGKQCVEIIQSAATSDQTVDSDLLLKSLVEETIINGNGNGDKPEEISAEASKTKAKPKTRAKVKAKAA
jgi:cell division protease FtsH